MLPEFIQSLLRPEAYPHPVGDIKVIQTHISYVLMTGQFVYKIKKPVNLGFLDFTTLDRRRYYCEREVWLNKRLAPAIYDRVVGVTSDGQSYIEGPGEVIEYAVKMLQMPEDRMMDRLIKEGKLTQLMVEQIVQKLVPFYVKAAAGPEIDFYGEPSQIGFNLEENFRQTEAYVGRALSRECFETIREYSLSTLDSKADLFKDRIKSKKIRDGHGDLYSANICIADDVYVYDCIEFNERFRYADIASDVAFLAMDLDFHGLHYLSTYFTDRFAQLSDDHPLGAILDFYKCYRAYVRGKVHCLSADGKDMEQEGRERALFTAQKYFGLAYQYAGIPKKPTLWVLFGPIAGGKSSLARELGHRLNVVPLNSDRVRKQLAGLQPTDKRPEAFGQGIYSSEFSRHTYARLFEEAEASLKRGKSVILDASFSSKSYRKEAISLAERLEVPYCFVYCYCSETETKARLARRAKNAEAVSDGRWEIFLEQAKNFEPPDEIAKDHLICIATDGPKERVRAQLFEGCPRIG